MFVAGGGQPLFAVNAPKTPKGSMAGGYLSFSNINLFITGNRKGEGE